MRRLKYPSLRQQPMNQDVSFSIGDDVGQGFVQCMKMKSNARQFLKSRGVLGPSCQDRRTSTIKAAMEGKFTPAICQNILRDPNNQKIIQSLQ